MSSRYSQVNLRESEKVMFLLFLFGDYKNKQRSLFSFFIESKFLRNGYFDFVLVNGCAFGFGFFFLFFYSLF